MKELPGPRGKFPLGSVGEFQADKLGFLRACAATYGDMFAFRLGPARLAVIGDLEAIRRMLVDDAARFTKSHLTREIFGRLLGDGLMISEGDTHRLHRRLIQPAFDSKRLALYAETAKRQTARLTGGWREGELLQVDAEMTKLTLHITAEVMFGASSDSRVEEIAHAMHTVQSAGASLYNSGFIPPRWLPTPKNRLLTKAIATVDAILGRLVAERIRRPTDHGDILSVLLLATDDSGRRLTPGEARDEARTLFLSGFETTANMLTWTWYFIGRSAGIQRRLEQESLRRQASSTEDTTYASMVVKESLRVCCPIWAFNRSPRETESIGGYRVGPRDVVIVSPYLLHRDPRYFPDPDVFDPERFRPEREKGIPRMAYLPFGAGPRSCIGARLALLESSAIVASIASRFRLTLPDGYQAEPDVFLSVKPKGGLTARVSLLPTAAASLHPC